MNAPAWLQRLAIASLILGFGSAVVIGIDVFRRPQPMAIMNADEHKRERPFWQTIIVERL
jgi:hypothetical protein